MRTRSQLPSYDIAALKQQELRLTKNIRDHFIAFFREHDYGRDTKHVVSANVASLADVQKMSYGSGLYVIFTDYQCDANPCVLETDGLKAIYRGHSVTMKKRLLSHLLNDHYRQSLTETGVRYDVCIKLDDKNGINIDQPPYSRFRWRVAVHKMPQSTKLIREQAELAFDEVFGRPLGSREGTARNALATKNNTKKQGPQRPST